MRELRRRLSGLALPTYVLDIPGGHGKVPIGPFDLQRAERQLTVDDAAGSSATPTRIAAPPTPAGPARLSSLPSFMSAPDHTPWFPA